MLVDLALISNDYCNILFSKVIAKILEYGHIAATKSNRARNMIEQSHNQTGCKKASISARLFQPVCLKIKIESELQNVNKNPSLHR